jgi:tetratricopeptide (TPR) repeat protein
MSSRLGKILFNKPDSQRWGTSESESLSNMELTNEQALQQAVEAHKAGKLQHAEALYRAILQAQPKHPDANHNLGVLAVSLNKTEDALPLFKIALEANPNQGQFWLSYVEALIKEEQFENARNVLEEGKKRGLKGEKVDVLGAQLTGIFLTKNSELSSVNKTPTFNQQLQKISTKKEKKNHSPRNLINLNLNQKRSPSQNELNALLEYYQKDRYDLANNLAKNLTQQYPKHPFGWKVLGALLKQTGKLQDSVIANQKVLEISPNDAEAHSNLGITLQELGRLEEAETSYKKAIAIKPDLAEAHYNFGITLQELGRLEEAETSYKKAIAIKPDYAEAHSNFGITLQQLGRLEEAETSYRKAIAIRLDYAEAHYNLGNTLRGLGRLEEADASYRKAIAIKPDLAEALSNLGDTLKERGRLEEAEVSYKKAISIKPDLAEAHYNFGITLQELGRLEEAETSYRKAIAIRLDYAEAHYNLGNTLRGLGRLEEADASYRKAIAIKPDLAEALSNLGDILEERGRLEEAEVSYKKAISIKPDLAEAHSNLGNTLKERGKLEEAEVSYKKAIAIKPELLEAFSNLSSTLLFSNKLNEAAQVLIKIIEIDPEGYGLKACVDLAILNFLNGNQSLSKSLLLKSTKILEDRKLGFKNEVVYWNYLSMLLVSKENKIEKEIDKLKIKKLYVIGESHSLASHETYIKKSQSHYLCQSFWIVGCKQWHIGNNHLNQYKEKLRRVIDSVPNGSKILLAIGEIDCRLDGGLLKHIRNYLEKSQSELIQSTVENYLNYVHQLTIPKSLDVIIQGVPCPNIDPNNVEQSDLLQLINLIREFNKVLQDGAKKRNFDFLDLHKMTDRGDGFSNGLWHIDQHHLSPAGMIEAWRRHLNS